MTIECIELDWLCKHMKKVRTSEASISKSSCVELGKTQFFPKNIVNESGRIITGYCKLQSQAMTSTCFFLFFFSFLVAKL